MILFVILIVLGRLRPGQPSVGDAWHEKNDDDDNDYYEYIRTSLGVFAASVKVLHACPNSTILLTPYGDSGRHALRYVVTYWPKGRPQEWQQRFSRAGGKQAVRIDGLLASTHYTVRVTALMWDGSSNEFRRSYTTPTSCGMTEKLTHTDNLTTCHPSITKEMVSGQSMSVKWTKTCQASHFDGYVVSYVTRIDYRQVYVNITQHSFVFRGMVAAPRSVSVAAVPMAVQKMYDIATVNTDAPKSADQLSNNGLLISVIILSILFVISGLMAIYLCCYLRMLKLTRAYGTPSTQCVNNRSRENVSLDVKRECEEKSSQDHTIESVHMTTTT